MPQQGVFLTTHQFCLQVVRFQAMFDQQGNIGTLIEQKTFPKGRVHFESYYDDSSNERAVSIIATTGTTFEVLATIRSNSTYTEFDGHGDDPQYAWEWQYSGFFNQ